MIEKKKIIALIGSIKKESLNQKIVENCIHITHDRFDVVIFPIETLPFFNPDLENDTDLPKTVIEFRHCIEAADGVLICTPEYVFSIPGILKNALEWTVSTIVFNEKPTAIVTAASVGEKTHASLHLVMTTIGAKIGDTSALLIQNVKAKINPEGVFVNEETLSSFQALIEDFDKNMTSAKG